MPGRNRKNGRSVNNRNGNKSVPERIGRTLDFTKTDPYRKVIIASQIELKLNDVTITGFSHKSPPGNAIPLVVNLLGAFDSSRVVSLSIFFDQRGASSTAAVPRCTAWVATESSAAYSDSLIGDIANFAGSGMTQVQPGKPYKIALGPKFTTGRFEKTTGSTQNNSLIIATQDYKGTVRVETTFETYGPPFSYEAL